MSSKRRHPSNRHVTILEELRELGDLEIAGRLAQYFKTGPGEYGEGDRFLGVRVPRIRRLVARHATMDDTSLRVLLRSPWHEARMLALLVLVEQFRRADSTRQATIYDCYLAHTSYINNWDLVDASAGPIVGGYLANRSRRPLRQLAHSTNVWERRIAIIATSHFIRLGQFTDTFAVSELLLRDDHDLIHKAVGWMLREVGKRDLGAEERFLRRHYRRMPRTMLRYAIERFPPERRNDYLKGLV